MRKSALIFYLTIILICIAFFSFFGEGLPRFTYDDISHYKIGSETRYTSLLLEIADFIHKGYDMRVTNYLLSKLYLDFFGENLYLYRLMKILAVSLGMCMLASLLIKEGVSRAIIMPSFILYLTSPILLIGTLWIVMLGTWSLFSKVLAFFIFFNLYKSEDRGIKYYSLCIVFLMVMIFGVKTREDFTLTPFIILTFLLLKRSRSFKLYLLTAAAIVIAFPYYIFSWGSGGIGGRFHLSNLKMFSVYFNQIAVLIPFILYSVYISATRKIVRNNDVMTFSLIWFSFEAVMVFLYPSYEMRYLEAFLLATVFLFTNFIGIAFKELQKQSYIIALMMFLLFAGYRIFENVKWDYSFRGSFASFFMAVDKQMKYINERYNNSLCLYVEFILLYYDWKTTNHYVNLSPDNAWGRKFEEFYSRRVEPDGRFILEFKNPEKYEHIILLDKDLLVLNLAPVIDYLIFDGTGATFFDNIQRKVNFRICDANVYNTKLGSEVNYPIKKAIFILRNGH